MKLGLAQLNLRIGAFRANAQKILAYLRECDRMECEVMVTSEMALSGYPPQDLVLHAQFIRDHENQLRELITETKDYKTDLVLGCIRPNTTVPGQPLWNSVLWISGGKVLGAWNKSMLPSSDIFDEPRFFQLGTPGHTLQHRGREWRILICEEMWDGPQYAPTHLISREVETPGPEKTDIILSLHASPFHVEKHAKRLEMARRQVEKYHAPLVYVSQSCAVDHVIFDGSSFVLDAHGNHIRQLPAFEECLEIIDTTQPTPQNHKPKPVPKLAPLPLVRDALLFGIREYMSKSNQKGVVLGLSGGVDSSVVASLAAEALGPRNVHGIAMPGPFSSPISLEDAETLASQLGIHFHTLGIDDVLRVASTLLGREIHALDQLTAYENLQSRIRGMLLMTYANAMGLIVLNTSNKSEIAVGYCTMYGDTNGAFAPIGDLLKHEIYELAQIINHSKIVIPERVLSRAPSAELRLHQTDQQSLPDYAILDAIIQHYIVDLQDAPIIAKTLGVEESFVQTWIQKIEGAEFKRRQLPFSLRISRRAFDSGRRIPIIKY